MVVARLDSLVRDAVATPIPGVSVAVVKGSDTLYLGGAGYRNVEQKLPAERGTVYRIGSITKQFTSSAIMQLVEKGRLHLTDTLGTLLPEYPQWRGITLRQLLNHTSGIHSYTSNRTWAATWSRPLTPAQVVDFVKDDTLDFAPGSAYRYNNTGYVLLGIILERVTGTPYATLMQRSFFTPLGMQSAGYCPSRATDPSHAAGYAAVGGKMEPAEYLDMSHPFSAGALCMSVPDYLRWQTALTSGRVVSMASYAQMSTGDTVNNGQRTGYGFGLMQGQLGKHPMIMHNGGVHGFSTDQRWLPSDSLRVVVFVNAGTPETGRLAGNLAAAVLGEPLRARPEPAVARPTVPLAAADRARYEGTYALARPTGSALKIRIWAEGDGLLSQAEGPGQGKIPLLYRGNDTFGAEFDPTLQITVLFENGKAVRARLQQRGNTLEGPRVP